jgi:hypothetical protein
MAYFTEEETKLIEENSPNGSTIKVEVETKFKRNLSLALMTVGILSSVLTIIVSYHTIKRLNAHING